MKINQQFNYVPFPASPSPVPIPIESLRTWKMLLLSLNEGFDKRSIDLLLALDKVAHLMVSGEGVLDCAPLIAADLVKIDTDSKGGFLESSVHYEEKYWVELSEKGRALVAAWKRGDQEAAIAGVKNFCQRNEERDK